MALPSSFRVRLEQMEETRNRRLSLLQAEKEFQINKSQVLASKLSNIRSVEQRCLKLDYRIAAQHFIISSLKSQTDRLDFNYLKFLQQYRVLKSEVEELDMLEKEKEIYYGSKNHEMGEFRAQVENLVAARRVQVEELRNRVNELKFSLEELQGSIACSNNPEITAAESRKSELLSMKGSLGRRLASNYQLRAQLQKQLQSLLIRQKRKRTPIRQFSDEQHPEQQTWDEVGTHTS